MNGVEAEHNQHLLLLMLLSTIMKHKKVTSAGLVSLDNSAGNTTNRN